MPFNLTLDNVLLNETSNTSSTNINNIKCTGYDNYDVVSEYRKFVLETQRELIDSEKYLYACILESEGYSTVINEGFSNFINKIKDAIKKFVNWIKNAIIKFINKVKQLFSKKVSSKGTNKSIDNMDLVLIIEYYAKNLDKFKPFNIKGYRYTNLDSNHMTRPNIEHCTKNNVEGYEQYTNTLDTILDIASSSYKGKDEDKPRIDQDYVYDYYKKFKQSLTDTYETLRAELVGKSSVKISRSEFSDELFRYFRNGTDTESEFTVEVEYLDTNLKCLLFPDFVKTTNDEWKSVEQYCKDECDNINNMIKKISDSINNNNEISDKAAIKDTIDKYALLYSDKILNIISIAGEYFTAKIAAGNEALNQLKAMTSTLVGMYEEDTKKS